MAEHITVNLRPHGTRTIEVASIERWQPARKGCVLYIRHRDSTLEVLPIYESASRLRTMLGAE